MIKMSNIYDILEDCMNSIFDILFPLVVIMLLVYFMRGKTPVQYDERQIALRGAAYRLAFIVGIFSGYIEAFLLKRNLLPMDGSLALMTSSFLMITVYVVYSISKDVYFGISGNWKKWTLVIFIIGIINLVTGILQIRTQGLPAGILTSSNMDIIMGIMFLVISIAAVIKNAREKNEEE